MFSWNPNSGVFSYLYVQVFPFVSVWLFIISPGVSVSVTVMFSLLGPLFVTFIFQ